MVDNSLTQNKPMLPAPNWYQNLLSDCQELIEEAKKSFILKNWEIGKRIIEDELHFQRPEYGNHTLENLANDLNLSQRTIYYQVKFAKQFPEFCNALQNLAWRDAIKLLTSPAHVSHNSGDNEWYSPTEYVESARQLMGSIDVDPASSDKANEIIKAETYYTAETDGCDKPWQGNVWMNPPYAQPLIKTFTNSLVDKFQSGEIKQACVLVNNATETEHYQNLLRHCKAVCFIKGRVKFIDPDGNPSGAPLQGQTILYFGSNVELFVKHFSQYGVILHAE